MQEYKAAKPVKDPEVLRFWKETVFDNLPFGGKGTKDFLHQYRDWLESSRLNRLHGFAAFKSLAFTHGTIQAFDMFYAKHHARRFRCFRGEFVYHRLSWRNHFPTWQYVEDDPISKEDALVVSVPFSDLGGTHPDLAAVLSDCERLQVPVLLDLAYYSIARDIEIDVSLRCIETLTFSLSKSFYGADRLRIGLRGQREAEDDPIDVFNGMDMVNRAAVLAGSLLLSRFPPDYCQERYAALQADICKELGVHPSQCVQFAIGDERFASINRGSRWNRLCIADAIADRLDPARAGEDASPTESSKAAPRPAPRM